jgi:hypothetical protein
MLRRVALAITSVSEERIAPVIRVAGIGELGNTLTLTRFSGSHYIEVTERNLRPVWKIWKYAIFTLPGLELKPLRRSIP